MKQLILSTMILLSISSANASSADSIVCKSYCEANFERTVESPLNQIAATKVYSVRISELNTEIETISLNDRSAALAAAIDGCKNIIKDEVLGYNKKIISINLYTDKTKSTRINMHNLNCISSQVVTK